MIRILHIVSSLSVGSGVMSCLIRYQRALDPSRVTFDYLYFKESATAYREEIERCGGTAYRIPRPAATAAFFSACESFFAAHGASYKIMHCHPVFAAAIFGPSAKKYGIRVVIQHSHTTQYGGNRASSVRNFLIELCLGRRATHFAACSEAAKRIFFWERPDRIQLIPNALDTERYRFSPADRQDVRTALGIPASTAVIGHIGRFTPQKNQLFLLELCAAFVKERPDSVLMLIGSGPLEGEIRKAAEEKGLRERVLFLGQVDNPGPFYSAMDAFVLPSRFEGLPITAVEAQANGLPCFLSEYISAEANLSGKCRYLSVDKGAELWSAALADQVRVRNGTESETASLPKEYDIQYASERLADYYKSLLVPDGASE